MGKKLSDLQDLLFDTIEELVSLDDNYPEFKKKIAIEKARVVAEIGKVMVESAKVEVDYIKAVTSMPLNLQNDKILSGFLGKNHNE